MPPIRKDHIDRSRTSSSRRTRAKAVGTFAKRNHALLPSPSSSDGIRFSSSSALSSLISRLLSDRCSPPESLGEGRSACPVQSLPYGGGHPPRSSTSCCRPHRSRHCLRRHFRGIHRQFAREVPSTLSSQSIAPSLRRIIHCTARTAAHS